ncbi:MAG: AAA family ATPase [Oscillospiraceae bacterium]|nr:AAA family ATPase [Oscillospiraceae bacterium]
MCDADTKKGTTCANSFCQSQQKILEYFSSLDGDFTFAEATRITELHKPLVERSTKAITDSIDAVIPKLELGEYDEKFDIIGRSMRTVDPEIIKELQELEKVGFTTQKVLDKLNEQSGLKEADDILRRAGLTSSSGQQDKDKAAKTTTAPEEELPPPEKLEDVLAELDSLVGLTEIKNDVQSLANFVKVRNLRQERGLKTPDMSLHLVFTGNPGTGKSTVARLIGRIYRSLGALSKGQLIEVDRSDLVGGYVGQTAIKTQEVIQKAMGGVLFIDEAYALSPNTENDFGQESINTILKAMEDHRDDLVVIVAGYDELMYRFINSNPGLKSRFNKYFHFDDYTPDELWKIFLRFAGKGSYTVSPEAEELLKDHLSTIYMLRGINFGNARDVRNLFEKIIAQQANRIVSIENPTNEQILEITAEDLKGLIEEKKPEKEKPEEEKPEEEKTEESSKKKNKSFSLSDDPNNMLNYYIM